MRSWSTVTLARLSLAALARVIYGSCLLHGSLIRHRSYGSAFSLAFPSPTFIKTLFKRSVYDVDVMIFLGTTLA